MKNIINKLMRKIKEVLRLHFEMNMSQRQVANSLAISVSTVNKYINAFIVRNISWSVNDELLLNTLKHNSKTYSLSLCSRPSRIAEQQKDGITISLGNNILL